MNETPSLAVDGVRKEFGPVTALSGVDLTVEGPEILGLAGPNGSGKTTLIRCLLGLERPTAGEARVGGTFSREFDRADRERIGYMPQHTAVYDDLTVRENVAFFARLYGVGGAARPAGVPRLGGGGSEATRDSADPGAVDRALSVVGLDDRADARIGELSGGMVRRTSLACAIVHEPDVLFLDEPTVGLDPRLRSSMWAEFRDRRDDGTLVVVSTHYLGEATNCDRVCFLRDGRVLALDSPDGFLDATGTEDMEAAFLALLDERGGAETAADADDGHDAPGPDAAAASGGDTR
ncbi:MAG: ABC transporter ATP-binding protein [Haloarculaceae archaeon]